MNGTIIVAENIKTLEESVNEAGTTELVQELAKSLATYGFKGSISLNLEVVIVDTDNGQERGRTTRSFSSPFRHQ